MESPLCMMDLPYSEALTHHSHNGSEIPVGIHSCSIPYPEHDETNGPLPESIEEFIRDRFSTKLENPRTGRKTV